MKKTIIAIIIIFLVTMCVLTVSITENRKSANAVQKFNKEYENYLHKEIYGAELVTIMNKVIDCNLKNGIPKDEQGFFVENDTNSIKIEIEFLYDDKTVTYQMENIYNRGTDSFIQNFNLTTFKLTSIEYHQKTNQIKKMMFIQLEP